MMTCSLIITTYNWSKALKQTLQSIVEQTKLPDEIIIADDGSTDETKKLVKKFSTQNPHLNIIYSWQKDDGFRAAMSRNKAIAKSISEFIILIDGDMILEKNFILDHLKFAKKGYFTQGSRVLIKERETKEIFETKLFKKSFTSIGISNRKNAIRSYILKKMFSNISSNLKGIKTCNLAFFKQDCIDVNGFNEDFIGWGREDSEFIVRLFNIKIKRQNLRFSAVAFHLYHKENNRNMLEKNDKMLHESIKNNFIWCKNGISKYLGEVNDN